MMHHLQDHTKQKTHNTTSQGKKLTALGITTALALLGIALIFLLFFLLIWLTGSTVVLPILAFAIVALIAAGLIATGVDWAPALGALVALAIASIVLAMPLASSALLHPASTLSRFGGLVIQFACALTAVVAGVAATIQNYSKVAWGTPRWLRSGLTGLTGLVVGMMVVALIVAANPQSGPASATTNGMPTVHMAGSNFLTNVVLVPKGSKLLLVDDDSVEHILQNGSWTASGLPQSRVEPGAPVVRGLDLKGVSAQIGPFTTAGVFHLYCTIHRGMNLAVVVQ
jgi:hypothetical protein